MKIATASRLAVDPHLRPGYVVTTMPWVVTLDSGWWVLVPDRMWSDGASIPAILRPMLSPLALLATGVLHDYAVRRGAMIQPPPSRHPVHAPQPISLRLATGLAVAMAERTGVGPVRRWAIGAALRVAAPAYFQRRGLGWRP